MTELRLRLAASSMVLGVVLSGCNSWPPPNTPTGTASISIPATSGPPASPGVTVVPAAAPETPGNTTVLLNEPRMVFVRAEDQPHAPETFVVSGDTITIADRVGQVISTYQGGRRTDTVPFPDVKIHDMAVRDDRYYFLTADQDEVVEYRLRPDPRTLQQVRTFPLAAAARLIRWDGENLVAQTIETNKWILVSGPGPTTPNPSFELDGKRFQITDGQLRIQIPTRWEPTGIELLARDTEYSYYRVDDNYTKPGGQQVYRGYIYTFDGTGRFIHSYTLVEASDYAPSREVQIADGKIYQLQVTKKTARILLLAPNP